MAGQTFVGQRIYRLFVHGLFERFRRSFVRLLRRLVQRQPARNFFYLHFHFDIILHK
uniref:Uncharacterized protein n=1 Tax=Romanomermis culicivorax TaxID=13658 RepID=A0A915IKX8_ROMCU